MRKISIKLNLHKCSDVVYRYFLSRARAAPFMAEQNHCAILIEGIMIKFL